MTSIYLRRISFADGTEYELDKSYEGIGKVTGMELQFAATQTTVAIYTEESDKIDNKTLPAALIWPEPGMTTTTDLAAELEKIERAKDPAR